MDEYDNSEAKFKLMQEFGDWDDGLEDEQPKVLKDTVPALENGWGRYGEYELVGNGKITNEFCGKYLGLKGCVRTDLHEKVTLEGENFEGKVYVQIVHHYCDKPSCPICFKSGWAVREADRIEQRLKEGRKHFGQIEHIVISIPSKDYGLSFPSLRKKALKVLSECGVIGGVMIPHAFRYSFKKNWYFSPHFHVIGFILGGYGRCRHCKGGNCYACDGFEGRVYRAYRENGYIVRALGERKTIFGTAWYQLNHASIRANVKRSHVATWFGICSYRKLKVTVEKHKALCPICNEELEKLYYMGEKRIVKDKNEHSYVASFVDDLLGSDGLPNWAVAHG